MPRTSQGKFVTEAASVFQEGDDLWKAGKYDEAAAKYEKSAGLYHQKDDVEGEAFALTRLGELELSLDNFSRAAEVLKVAADLVKHKDFAQNTYGDILIKLAKVYADEGELAKALQTTQKAQEVLEANNSHDLLGDAYEQEAYVLMVQNKEAEALEAYKKASELFRTDGIGLKEAASLRAIARIYMKQKKYEEAHEVLERCRMLYRENGDLLGEASALSAIGCLRYIIRDIENARKALMKSVYLYGKLAHHFAEAEALLYLARVEAFDRAQGDFERAKRHYKRAVDLFDFLGNETMKRVVLDEYHTFLNRIANL